MEIGIWVTSQMRDSSASLEEYDNTATAISAFSEYIEFLMQFSSELSPELVTSILRIVPNVQETKERNWTAGLLDVISKMNDLIELVTETTTRRAGSSFRTQLREASSVVQEHIGRLEVLVFRNQDRQISEILDHSREVLRNTRTAAAAIVSNSEEVAELTLGDSFKKVADKEELQADAFRWFAISMFPIAFLVALYIVARDQNFRWSVEFLKLVVDVPILAAAFFFQSESKDHRQNARRAREIEIRLATVRSYTDGLPDQQRDDVRTSLGLAIFKEPSVLAAPKGADEAVANLVEKIAELIKAAKS